MITIGLTTWTEHPALIGGNQRPVTLSEYSGVLPTVEVDTPFYGIPKVTTIQQWQRQVPAGFQFVLKANQVMTQHDQGKQPVDEAARQQAFRDFRTAVAPLVTTHQLKTVLFQFPPFFGRTTPNIRYLRDVRQQMGQLPVTVEFRHPSWFGDGITDALLTYLQSLHLTLAVVDEPHNLNDGVPRVAAITTPTLAFVRLHGQNAQGWFNRGANWRKTRTLYNYSMAELTVIADMVRHLADQAQEVCVIFNNNAGRHAAKNAQQLQALLGLHFDGLGPRQLALF